MESLKKRVSTENKNENVPSSFRCGVLPGRSLCPLESHGVCLECYRALEISGNGCHPSCAGTVFPAFGVSQFVMDESCSVPLLSVI